MDQLERDLAEAFALLDSMGVSNVSNAPSKIDVGCTQGGVIRGKSYRPLGLRRERPATGCSGGPHPLLDRAPRGACSLPLLYVCRSCSKGIKEQNVKKL